MFGPQFDRTYWQNPDTGNTTYYAPFNSDTRYGADYDPQGQVGAWKAPLRDRRDRSELPHQGLLFHPSTGTGAGRDPLMEDTAPLIRKALRLEDKDQYDKRARRFGSTDFDSVASGAVSAIKGTSMPPHVLQHINASVTVDPHEGRSHASPVNRSVTVMHQGGKPDWHALTHELGHTIEGWDNLSQTEDWVKGPDESGRYRGMVGRPDPRSEGIADGLSDRFTRLASAQSSPASMASLHHGTGYSTQFSGFKDKVSRALYSAARAHVSMNDPTVEDSLTHKHGPGGDVRIGATGVPARDDLMERAGLYRRDQADVHVLTKTGRSSYSRREYTDVARSKVIADSSANSLLLGHLAHHNPAIIPHLEAQGFGKVVQESVGMYHNHFPQHAPAPATEPQPEYEQLTMDLGSPKKKR